MTPYAIFRCGGRQVRAAVGERILVDRLPARPGEEVRFEEVLLVGGEEVKVGRPTVAGAAVVAEVEGEEKGEKLVVFKFKRRKNYARKQGHRQGYTRLRITRIES